MTFRNDLLLCLMLAWSCSNSACSQEILTLSSNQKFSSVSEYANSSNEYEFDIDYYFPRVILKNQEHYFVNNGFSNCQHEQYFDSKFVKCSEIGDVGYLTNSWNNDYVTSLNEEKEFKIFVNSQESTIEVIIDSYKVNLAIKLIGRNTIDVYLHNDLLLIRNQLGSQNYIVEISSNSIYEIKLDSSESLLGVSSAMEFFTRKGNVVRQYSSEGEFLTQKEIVSSRKYYDCFYDFDSENLMLSIFNPEKWVIETEKIDF